jgi:hypothetical protein
MVARCCWPAEYEFCSKTAGRPALPLKYQYGILAAAILVIGFSRAIYAFAISLSMVAVLWH